MTLDEAETGDVLRVVRLSAESSLAGRLRALGMNEGARITVIFVPRRRRLVYVRTASATAVVGRAAARLIGVEK